MFQPSRRGRRVVVASFALAVIGATATVGGSGAGAQTPAPVISVAEAREIVRGYQAVNATNNETLNVERQRAIEADPILAIDDATFREYQGRGETTLGEGRTTTDEVRVFVPAPGPVTPRQFLVTERISSGGASFRQVLLFVQAAEGDPWKVSMAAQLETGERLPALLVDRAGAAQLVDADHAADLRARPEALAPDLVQVWTRAAGEERAPSAVFADGALTTGIIDAFVNRLGQTGLVAQVDFSFATDDDHPPAAYRTKRGGALVLFAVRSRELIRPLDGEAAVRQPGSREPLGGLVPPGAYASVQFERVAIVLANVPRAGTKAKAEILGIYDGNVGVSATSVP